MKQRGSDLSWTSSRSRWGPKMIHNLMHSMRGT